MSAIKIDKNIPAPNRRMKYPWLGMEIGDSFFVEADDSIKASKQHALSSAASAASRRYKRRFTTREVDGGLRVWRVE